jgi:PEP-CTERM motif
MKRLATFVLTLTVLLLGAAGSTRADLFTVDSQAGPWLYSATLNSAFTYGVGDMTAPTTISAADGFDFTPGGTFTVTYVSGLTSPFGGVPYADASGDPGYDASNNSGSSGMFFPSLYINSLSYPAFLNALIGTFADDSGAIVGTPFLVGNLGSFVVPVGATRLQLGVNDDIFSDNTGALIVDVSGPRSVPEPSSMALLGLGIAGATFIARRRARQVA